MPPLPPTRILVEDVPRVTSLVQHSTTLSSASRYWYRISNLPRQKSL